MRAQPVPGTGRRRRGGSRSRGVSANSKVLAHRYPGEGDRGAAFRRLIRKVERRFWRREAREDGIR